MCYGAVMEHGFSTKLFDDRKERVRFGSMTKRQLLETDEQNREELMRLHKRLKIAIRHESRRITPDNLLVGVSYFTMWIIVYWVVVSGLSGAGLFGSGRFFMIFPPIVFWGGIIMSGYLLRRYAVRRARKKVAATMVAEGICGTCGYSLRGLGVQDDGCIVCTECGSAWRASRVTSAYWEESDEVATRKPGWVLRNVFMVASEVNRTTTDARSRFVLTVDSRLVVLSKQQRETLSPELRKSIIRKLRKIGRIFRVLLALFMMGIASLFGLIGYVMLEEEMLIGTIVLWFIGSVIFLLGVVMQLRGDVFLRAVKVARVMVRQGLCPVCVSRLAGLEQDDDGCVVCLSCGSAWRVDDIPWVVEGEDGSNNEA